MAVDLIKERYTSRVGEVVLGATAEEGGTRSHTITIGGDSTMPFLRFEGEVPHKPVVAMEVVDRHPEEWNPVLREAIGDEIKDPVAWAQKCVNEFGADLIFVRLQGADPDLGDAGPEKCQETVKAVLEAVQVPLIVVGCGNDEKDNLILPAVAEAAAGENLLIGTAIEENYKTLTAACMVHKHSIIALSPIDINIAKQLNILINEMNLPLNRIVSDPTTGALGYGLEYSYSIIERARLGALGGDRMLAMPVLCTAGYEAWRAKEANASVEEFPDWGQVEPRAVMWEALTSTALLQAGAHLLVLRHPRAVKLVQQHIAAMMKE